MCSDLYCTETILSSRWNLNTGSSTSGLLCGPEEIGQQSLPYSWVPRLIGKIDIAYVFTHHSDGTCLGQRLYLDRSKQSKTVRRAINADILKRRWYEDRGKFLWRERQSETSPHITFVWATAAFAYLNFLAVSPHSPSSSQSYPTTSEKKVFNIWNASAAVSVWESSGSTRSSTPGCDLVPRISSVPL